MDLASRTLRIETASGATSVRAARVFAAPRGLPPPEMFACFQVVSNMDSFTGKLRPRDCTYSHPQRQRSCCWLRSTDAPAAAPTSAPMIVPAVRERPPSMMLPSNAPAPAPTMSPVVPSVRLQ